MAITNKEEFIQYCLRQLGAPMINIEVHDDNLMDAYEDAIRAFQDAHFDGFERIYLKHQLTALDITNGYIPLHPSIMSVANVFSLNGSNTTNSIFNLDYQIHQNDLWDLGGGGGLAYFVNIKQYVNMMQQILVGQTMYRFTRTMDKVYIDVKSSKLIEGEYIVLECSKALIPEEYPKIWTDPWFKKYTTALIKKAWGSQLKKYNNILTIGGVSVDGQNIFNEAIQDIAELKQELQDKYEMPVNFLVG